MGKGSLIWAGHRCPLSCFITPLSTTVVQRQKRMVKGSWVEIRTREISNLSWANQTQLEEINSLPVNNGEGK